MTNKNLSKPWEFDFGMTEDEFLQLFMSVFYPEIPYEAFQEFMEQQNT